MIITKEQIERAKKLNALEWHLRNNFVPAYTPSFAPTLLQAIDNCSEGNLMAEVEFNKHKYVSVTLVEDFKVEDMVSQENEIQEVMTLEEIPLFLNSLDEGN